MGKIAVTAACGLLAFGLSDLNHYTDPVNHPDSYLSSPLMPVLISVLVGYTISNLFLQVSRLTSGLMGHTWELLVADSLLSCFGTFLVPVA